MKLKLTPDPTFKATVSIPVPGGDADIVCEFKYRSKAELDAWQKEMEKAKDVEFVQGIVVGWNLDDEFNADNLARLFETYPRASHAIIVKYARELAGVREGN